jgi:hypothetical protein
MEKENLINKKKINLVFKVNIKWLMDLEINKKEKEKINWKKENNIKKNFK